MGKSRKFGTMGGVFTPSILTILGVIMYMRLGWVIGNSDTLFIAILIVLLAHVVSVTTGLSVSSVATDKKIRGGGIYYMLSRSLGFPIGGAIGITLFLATALSISLYLIGFAESLLSISKDWFGIENITVNHLRIVGSLALLMMVTIAYISTSIAIKTQYIILGLIGLSLFSVFLGSSEGKGFDYTSITTSGLETVGFATLFGVFFPAVTGFTAGVAMSGDLRNPQKSIPWGTMIAIGVGLIIYVSLTIFVFYEIPISELRTNTNVLVDFSLVPQLVVAGIWGATLSSALGGILGGPRILQAMSVDRITPRFFSKGVGKDNEPRRALLLIFVLAEMGVLIGELDVIAGIVTMFYMSAYLFINLSCFLEQWASPDFRPTFRVPLLVSLLGTIATFLLMIQLDIVAALVSVLVMTVIFLWLTRKQLELGSGDVWQNVWSSIVKLGLKKLNKKEIHQRNWEPNILLFSGGTNERPYLLELSKAIAGRNGMISNFDLIEKKSAKTLFPKNQQAIKVEGDDDGSIFFRRQECKHIYDGIETIAQTYGFSGVEPNTVLLGWGHHTIEVSQFTHMTETLHKLDYNILFFDYDKERGFGKKQKIDIWWRDLSHVSYFTVQLSKFLLASKDWGHSEVRFIYLNNDNSAQYAIKKAMTRITHELKNFVTIEIVNNETEQNSFYDVVTDFSSEADLIIIDLPRLTAENQETFIAETNKLLKNLGTTLIVKASSHFDKGKILDMEIEKLYNVEELKLNANFSRMNENLPKLQSSGFYELQSAISSLDDKLMKVNYLFVKSIYVHIEKIYNALADNIAQNERIDATFFEQVNGIISDIQENRLDEIVFVIDKKLKQYLSISKNLIKELPVSLKRQYTESELIECDQDNLKVKKLKKSLRNKRNKNAKKVHPLSVAQKYYKQQYVPAIDSVLKTLGNAMYEMNTDIKSWVYQWEGQDEESQKEKLKSFASFVSQNMKQVRYKTYYEFGLIEREFLNEILVKNDRLLLVGRYEEELTETKTKQTDLFKYTNVWLQNTDCLFAQLNINFTLFRVKYILIPKIKAFESLFVSTYIEPMMHIIQRLKDSSNSLSLEELQQMSDLLLELGLSETQYKYLQRVKYMKETLLEELPQNIDIINLSDLRKFAGVQNDIIPESLELRRIVRYLLDNDIFYEVEHLQRTAVNEIRIEQFKIENILKILEQKETEILEVKNDLDKIEKRIEKLSSQFSHELQYINSHCSEVLTDEFIWSQSTHLNGVVRKENSSKGFVEYKSLLKKIPTRLYSRLDTNITKGKDLLVKTVYQQRYKSLENPHAKWSDFVEEVQLTKEQKNEIPFYYQQLFLSKQKAPDIPLENRSNEWKRFNIAYKRFLNKTSGAVLVTGEPLSGRSYFIENILNVKKNDYSYSIEPPTVLYADTQRMFERALKNATMKNKSMTDILDEMPQGTVIVIEDLELWWNRTEKGRAIIDLLCSIIREYSKKVFFLLSCNIHFFTLVQKSSTIEQILQETIVLQPLSSQEIEHAIKALHATSGMLLEGSEADRFKSFKVNGEEDFLMKRIVAASGGNIGFSFHLWLSSMLRIEDNKLIYDSTLSFKSLPDVHMPMWDNILLQMLLHERLTKNIIFKIYKEEPRDFVENEIQSLLRTNIIEAKLSPNIYEINKFALAFVIKYLRKKKFIN